MQNRFAELRRKRAAGESGFTLIELLVVVVIIGILIAIAIPVYLNYQKGAKDKSAASDLRNAITALEQCNSDNGTYPSALAESTTGVVTITSTPACTQTINLSSGTVISYTASSNSYKLLAYNTGGSPKFYCYNSSTGGSVQAVSAVGYTAATTFGTWPTFTTAPTC